MNNLREIAYRLDPVLWVREILGMTPARWQETFLRAPRGASILGIDRAAGWQNDGGCMGDGTFMRCLCQGRCLWLPAPRNVKAPKRSAG